MLNHDNFSQNFMDAKFIVESTATDKISNYEVNFEELDSKTKVFRANHHINSVAGFQFRLKRRWTPIFINTYLPCTMLLLISFIGFLIPAHMIPGRMSLLVTIFLMLVNISSSEKTHGPNVIVLFTVKERKI